MTRFEWVVMRALWFLVKMQMQKPLRQDQVNSGNDVLRDIEGMFPSSAPPSKKWGGPYEDMYG